MGEGKPRRLNFLRDLTLVAAPLVSALVIARIVFSGKTAQGFSGDTGLGSFDFVTPGLISALVIFSLFYSLRRRGEQVARLVIAVITIAGTLSGLLLLKIWFDASIMVPALFYVSAAPLGYLGLYLSVRNYLGSLSERKTSLLLSGSASFCSIALRYHDGGERCSTKDCWISKIRVDSLYHYSTAGKTNRRHR